MYTLLALVDEVFFHADQFSFLGNLLVIIKTRKVFVMKILQVIGTLNPAYGGPVESLKQLSSTLLEMGHQVEIVTLDEANASYSNDISLVVHTLGPSLGKYRLNIRLVPWLINNAKHFDAVLCNGIWQYQSLAIWLASRFVKFPYFVFVHGALDPWFKDAYPLRHLKKRLYWPWAEYNVLRSAKAVLYTSEDEKFLAPKSFCLSKTNGVVFNLGIRAPSCEPDLQKEMFYKAYPSLREKHILLFLSRIHPKKGCDLLIEAFAQMIKQDSDLHLVMVGPDQEGWQSKLVQQASQLGVNKYITWTGMLSGYLKWGAYRAADVFILPSHSENFGIVIAEALACGLPVLMTNKVNIWREVEADDAGMIELDTLDGTISLLQRWLLLSQAEEQRMRRNAQRCFLKRYEINKATEKLVDIILPFIQVDS